MSEFAAWALVVLQAFGLFYLISNNRTLRADARAHRADAQHAPALAVEQDGAEKLEEQYRMWLRELDGIKAVFESRGFKPRRYGERDRVRAQIADVEKRGKELRPKDYDKLPPLQQLKMIIQLLLDKAELKNPLPDDWLDD